MDRLSEAILSLQEILGCPKGGYPPGKSPFADDPYRWRKTQSDRDCQDQEQDGDRGNGYDHLDPTKKDYLTKPAAPRIHPMTLTYIPRN